MNEVRDNGEHFSYTRTWEDIEDMLHKAERKQNMHFTEMQTVDPNGRTFVDGKVIKTRIYHMRNYKALEGVIKSLRWVLGDKNIQHPLE